MILEAVYTNSSQCSSLRSSQGSDDSAADMEDMSYFTGKNCLISQDDTFYDSLRPSQDRARYVGLGNFAGLGFKGTHSSKSIRVRNLELRRLSELDVIEDARDSDKGEKQRGAKRRSRNALIMRVTVRSEATSIKDI